MFIEDFADGERDDGFAGLLEIPVNLGEGVQRHKADLIRVTHKHQIRFNNIYEKQAQVIAELYRKLVQAHRLLGPARMARSFTAEDRKFVEQAFKAYWDALAYFDDNALYFEDSVFQKLKSFSTEMLKFAGFYQGFSDMMHTFNPEQRKKLNQEIDGKTLEGVILDFWKSMDEKTPELTADLLREFRRLLGVTRE